MSVALKIVVIAATSYRKLLVIGKLNSKLVVIGKLNS